MTLTGQCLIVKAYILYIDQYLTSEMVVAIVTMLKQITITIRVHLNRATLKDV